MKHWALVFIKLGALLLAIGLLPALAVAFLFRGMDPLIPGLLSLSVAPLGFIVTLIGAAMWLLARLRG